MPRIQLPPLPVETARAAESAFGRDHPYLRLGESLDGLWNSLDLSALEGRDAFLVNSFYPYAPATVLQHWEGLTDRQMSQALRTRVDLKYALHLPLNLPGIQPSRLCLFRQCLFLDAAGAQALQALAERLDEAANATKCPEGPDEMVALICLRSRAESVIECMGLALECIASCDPTWLRGIARPDWYRRYSPRLGQPRIPSDPAEIRQLIEVVANDGLHLLEALRNSEEAVISQLPEIGQMRDEWERQFAWDTAAPRLRQPRCRNCTSDFQLLGYTPLQRRRNQPSTEPSAQSETVDPGSFRSQPSERKQQS